MELFPKDLSQISSSPPVGSNENGSSRTLEEKDLIGRLDGHSGDDSGVDCTLSLRFPPGSSRRKDGTSSSKVGFLVAPTQPFPRLNEVFAHSNVNPMQAVIGSFTKAGHAGTATPIIVRKCLVCGTTQTPLWRNGPHGLKSLCNACGIRFKKEERRALMNGMIHSRVKPDSAHEKNDPELLKPSKKPRFQHPSNSSSQI